MKFIDNGIEFTNVLKAGVTTSSGPIAIKDDYLNDEEKLGYINKYKSNNKCLYVVNAIDIDWNGAQVDEGTTINTTGDLISWINSKSSDDCPECVVSSDKFKLETVEDLSRNNILLLCVNNDKPIFQIGGANSKIQKSMLSDEIKELLDRNPGEPVGNLTFNTNDFSISETNKVSLSDNIVRTTGDLEEVILADGSTKPLSEFGVVKGINKIDFYRWEEVIIPENSLDSGLASTFNLYDRLFFRITKNGVIIKDTYVDVLMDNLTDVNRINYEDGFVNDLPYISKISGFTVNKSYVKSAPIKSNSKALLNFLINSYYEPVQSFFIENFLYIELEFKKNDELYIFDNNDDIILNIPNEKYEYLNISAKLYQEKNVINTIINQEYIYVAKTDNNLLGSNTIEMYLNDIFNNIENEYSEVTKEDIVQYTKDFLFSYNDSVNNLINSLIGYFVTGNYNSVLNYEQRAILLTMAVYELILIYKARESSPELKLNYISNIINSYNNGDDLLENTYKAQSYIALSLVNEDYTYSTILSNIRNYYLSQNSDSLIKKTWIPIECNVPNVTAKWSDLISND